MSSYEDIIGLPRPVFTTRTPMPREDRAAQFAPFAALSGHEAAIRETARTTEERFTPDESLIEENVRILKYILDAPSMRPAVYIQYFCKDTKKSGGSYRTINGIIKKIDAYNRCIEMGNSVKIFFDDIITINIGECQFLEEYAK